MATTQVSIIIVSFHTQRLLSRCFESIRSSAGNVSYEVIVVDNGSTDGSVEYIQKEHPDVILIQSKENLGFAGANNLGFQRAQGEYIVLLNTDAFFVGDALEQSVRKMDSRPEVGLAGARLVSEDRSWQPSARTFPGLWNELVTRTGLSYRWPKSRLFGRPDLTFLDQNQEIDCDWVPGAFSIIRKSILDKIGFFDENFFLYYEEVDLCRRIKKDGWKIVYWPDLTVIHIGGASTSVFSSKLVTKSGMQMGLWRLQSQYLYYRKHHGWIRALFSRSLEGFLNSLRVWRNTKSQPSKAEEAQVLLDLMRRAWKQTKGGKISPPRPWVGV